MYLQVLVDVRENVNPHWLADLFCIIWHLCHLLNLQKVGVSAGSVKCRSIWEFWEDSAHLKPDSAICPQPHLSLLRFQEEKEILICEKQTYLAANHSVRLQHQIWRQEKRRQVLLRFGHSQVGTKSVRGHCCFNGCVRIPLLQNQEGKAFKPSGELSILEGVTTQEGVTLLGRYSCKERGFWAEGREWENVFEGSLYCNSGYYLFLIV